MEQEALPEDIPTSELDEKAKKIVFDEEYLDLKKFVKENKAAFDSAYAKPKKMLFSYIDEILRVKNENREGGRKWTLNSLRGYLDDSMINYLTSGIKYVPKNKKTHIAIGLAVGMTADALNEYLQMSGYAPLDGTCLQESLLMNLLEKWEETHPLQERFKKAGKGKEKLGKEEELQAINEMLGLRRDLKDAYEKVQELSSHGEKIKKFPYMNE